MHKIWITKYALTEGIYECESRDEENVHAPMAVVAWPGGMNGCAYFHGRDWHTSLEAAQARAEEMRIAKIKSLEKQIKKLSNYQPKIRSK